MGHKKHNKKIMAAVRVVLLFGGFMLGTALAVLFLRGDFVSISDWVRLAIVISCGVLLGLFLMLSARPIVWLVLAAGEKLKYTIRTRRPEEIAGYALGICLGVLLSLVAYILLTLFVPIVALNIALTIVIAVLLSFVGAIVCSRLMLYGASRETDTEKDKDDDTAADGYIVTSGALANEKAGEIIGRWLTGKLVVLELTGRLLAESDNERCEDALKLFGTLVAGGKLKCVGYEKSGEEAKDVISYASSRRLAVITGAKEEAEIYEGKAKVLCLENL
ncbi:MAG: hypothetical protein HFK09_02305 [Clostridia bacterium]|nr:hypothetical protein [Clostridia bacterium]